VLRTEVGLQIAPQACTADEVDARVLAEFRQPPNCLRYGVSVRLFTQDVKVEALRRTPLFSELSKKELIQLARMSEDLELDAGRVLCREGGFGAEFFVIIDGEVEVTRRGKPVRRAGGDDFFGEVAILEKIARTATVTAKTRCGYSSSRAGTSVLSWSNRRAWSEKSCAAWREGSSSCPMTRRSARKSADPHDLFFGALRVSEARSH